jgi:hypothetical protein
MRRVQVYYTEQGPGPARVFYTTCDTTFQQLVEGLGASKSLDDYEFAMKVYEDASAPIFPEPQESVGNYGQCLFVYQSDCI